jgi:5-formyltetrahydrofolate cyclo-ligase
MSASTTGLSFREITSLVRVLTSKESFEEDLVLTAALRGAPLQIDIASEIKCYAHLINEPSTLPLRFIFLRTEQSVLITDLRRVRQKDLLLSSA